MTLSSVQTGALAELASGGGVVVDLDITFAGQIVLFMLLFFVLKPLLFTPMLNLFEEREKRTAGAKDDARALYADADEKMAKYEAQVGIVKQKAGEERDRIRAEGQKREAAILGKVRDETNAMVEEGRAKIANERESLRAELQTVSNALARDIATRVLGREVQS